MNDKVYVDTKLVKKATKSKFILKPCPPMMVAQLADPTHMDWNINSIAAEFNRVLVAGWLPYFQEVATAVKLPAELLLAIASRETNMRNMKGDLQKDGYHGFGIMQVDIRTDYEFCCSWDEKDVKRSIERGAQILAVKKAILNKNGITDLKAIAAAYNTGEGNVMKSIKAGNDPDSTTTGHNYGSDIMKRASTFKTLIQQNAAKTAQKQPTKPA